MKSYALLGNLPHRKFFATRQLSCQEDRVLKSEATPVLLITDQEDDVVLFRHAFSRALEQVRFISFTSTADAQDYLQGAGEYANRDLHPLPDLILLTTLPHSVPSGLELLGHIKSDPSLHIIPIIVFADVPVPDVVTELYERGANAVSEMPPTVDALDNLVSVTLRFWLSNAMRPSLRARSDKDPARIAIVS